MQTKNINIFWLCIEKKVLKLFTHNLIVNHVEPNVKFWNNWTYLWKFNLFQYSLTYVWLHQNTASTGKVVYWCQNQQSNLVLFDVRNTGYIWMSANDSCQGHSKWFLENDVAIWIPENKPALFSAGSHSYLDAFTHTFPTHYTTHATTVTSHLLS